MCKYKLVIILVFAFILLFTSACSNSQEFTPGLYIDSLTDDDLYYYVNFKSDGVGEYTSFYTPYTSDTDSTSESFSWYEQDGDIFTDIPYYLQLRPYNTYLYSPYSVLIGTVPNKGTFDGTLIKPSHIEYEFSNNGKVEFTYNYKSSFSMNGTYYIEDDILHIDYFWFRVRNQFTRLGH